MCYHELSEHLVSCHCCLKCPNCSTFMLLFFIISLLLQLYFPLFALFQNKKWQLGLEFIADNRPIASSITGNLVHSIQQQHRLNLGPQRCLLPQQGQNCRRHPQGRHYGYMKATLHAWQDETDHPSYQRIGQLMPSCPATHGPPVQDPDEPANNAYNKYK